MKIKPFLSVLLVAIICISILYPITAMAKSTVTVKSISLSKTSLTLSVKSTYTLVASVSPSNATTKAVTWSSSDKATATISNGKISAIKAGTCTITAKSTNGNTATCKLTVNNLSATIKSVSSVNITTVAGTAPTLPSTITATMSDGTTKSITVKWNSISSSSYASAGTFAVIGTISASSNNQTTAIVTVTSASTATTVKSINAVTITTIKGKSPILPSTVTATMSDGTTRNYGVTWNNIASSNYACEGTFIVVGTISASSTVKATATVVVTSASTAATVQSISVVNVTTIAGTAPDFPSIVTATMSDGTTKNYGVTWNSISYSNYAIAGTFTVIGTISASSTIKATATVIVTSASTSTAVQSISAINVTTLAGTAPDLPSTLPAVMSDGTTKYITVTWDTFYPSQYANAGAFTLSGTISESSTIKATAIVIVTGSSTAVTVKSISSVYSTTMVGTAPDLPSTVTATMSDGTTKNFGVTWVYFSPSSYATNGTFTIRGIISTSTTIEASATVIVISSSTSSTIESINTVSITTLVGTAPNLPSTVTATMSDGTTKNFTVTWNSISSSSYASAGTVTVYGTVSTATTIKVTAIVTVG